MQNFELKKKGDERTYFIFSAKEQNWLISFVVVVLD
jgi:hypothetical protein